MNEVLSHPEAAQLIDSLVASGGGHLSYSIGAPGREMTVAAGARLAAANGTPLTIVDFRHLHAHIRSTVAGLHPDLPCTVLSAGEAAQQSQNPEGVWVVHTELLRAPSIRDALLTLARNADTLITAGRDDLGEPLPDALAAPRFVFRPSDPNTLHSQAALQRPAPAGPEREQRLVRQNPPAPGQDPVSIEEFALTPTTYPSGVSAAPSSQAASRRGPDPAAAHQPSPDRKATPDTDSHPGPDAGDGPGPDAGMYPMTQPTPEERDTAVWAEVAERKQRALELITPARPADGAGDDEPTLSYDEFRALCEAPDVQQMAAEIEAAARQRMEQAATALATPLLHGPAAARPGRPGAPGAAHHAQQGHTPPQPPAPGFRP
ncbi:hypothetical protein [Streptomyces solaniscabiei]|uniref:hypothetical protein n=1 Tax=Streptomyces solaniscabiei TaxID=2683255 RepID=UPI001CE30F0C|nr:hypothetical protein [Streptomyces solaniscabiei]